MKPVARFSRYILLPVLALVVGLPTGIGLSVSTAANKQGGGVFTIQKKKPRAWKNSTSKKPLIVNVNQFDGTYQFKAKLRSEKKRSGFIISNIISSITEKCMSNSSMSVSVFNGKASSRLITGKLLTGYVQGNKLHFSSAKNSSGGYWQGVVELTTQNGANTTGYIIWDSDRHRCEYSVIGIRS